MHIVLNPRVSSAVRMTLLWQIVDLRAYWDSKGYPYEYVETDGGHIWRNWRIYLTMFAQKIFK